MERERERRVLLFWGLLFGRPKLKDPPHWLYGNAAKRNGLRLSRSLAEGMGLEAATWAECSGWKWVSGSETLLRGGKSIVGHTHFELVHFVWMAFRMPDVAPKIYRRISEIRPSPEAGNGIHKCKSETKRAEWNSVWGIRIYTTLKSKMYSIPSLFFTFRYS